VLFDVSYKYCGGWWVLFFFVVGNCSLALVRGGSGGQVLCGRSWNALWSGVGQRGVTTKKEGKKNGGVCAEEGAGRQLWSTHRCRADRKKRWRLRSGLVRGGAKSVCYILGSAREGKLLAEVRMGVGSGVYGLGF